MRTGYHIISEADEVRLDVLERATAFVLAFVYSKSKWGPRNHLLGSSRFNNPGRTGSEVYTLDSGNGIYDDVRK